MNEPTSGQQRIVTVEVLGSGTSTGVPVPGCGCAVCRSTNPLNSRLRTSVMIECVEPGTSVAENTIGDLAAAKTLLTSEIEMVLPRHKQSARILVDTSPDLRQQSLRAGITSVDAVLFTHTHADHVFGIDDLRSFNFVNDCEIPVYASDATCRDLESKFRYAFFTDPDYEGGAPPRLTLHKIDPYEPLVLCGITILPLPVRHGKLEVYGYRIGNFAYLTDCNAIPDRTKEHLTGLETLILDGLRHRPHRTHFTVREAVTEIESLRPRRSYLTHISHELEHDETNSLLRTLTDLDVQLAYDGLKIECAVPVDTDPRGRAR